MREPPQLRLGLVEDFAELPQPALQRRARIPAHAGDRESGSVEELPRFVVHRMGDPLDLPLHRLVQAAQGADRFAESAVRHLVGRKALDEELSRPADLLLDARGFGDPLQRAGQDLVVDRGELEQSDAAGDALTADLVGALKRVLVGMVRSRLHRVCVQRSQVANRRQTGSGRGQAAGREDFAHGLSFSDGPPERLSTVRTVFYERSNRSGTPYGPGM